MRRQLVVMDVGDLIVIDGNVTKHFAIFFQKKIDNSVVPIIFASTNSFYIGVQKNMRRWNELLVNNQNVFYSKRKEEK